MSFAPICLVELEVAWRCAGRVSAVSAAVSDVTNDALSHMT